MPDKEASYKHSEKKMPSEVEVLSVMKEIQEQITKGGSKEGDEAQPYPLSRIINCDETATHYSAQFPHQWVLPGADRGFALKDVVVMVVLVTLELTRIQQTGYH